jgi:hypothetical protein
MGMGGQRHAPVALAPVPNVQEAGWAPAPVWTDGCEKSHHHRDSITGPSARSEPLHRLRYPGPRMGGRRGIVPPILNLGTIWK